MKNMAEFFATLPADHPVMAIKVEHDNLSYLLESRQVGDEALPAMMALTTRLRDELENLTVKPGIVTSYIGLLDSDVDMMRAILKHLVSK